MKNRILTLSVLLLLGMVSCKSTVSTADMLKQEDKAQEELQDAQVAMIKLAQMKEQYSEDHKKQSIEELKKQQIKNEKDIDHLQDVTNENAQGTANSLISNLKKENKDIAEQIAKLENTQKENWSTSIEAINQRVKELEQEIAKINANIDHSQE